MPIMGGYQATVKIRELCSQLMLDTEKKYKFKQKGTDLSKVLIVALTANDTQDERKKCISAGMTKFLGKPPEMQELKSILKEMFPKRMEEHEKENFY